MSPTIFVVMLKNVRVCIYLGRTDWATLAFHQQHPAFSPGTATHTDARELSNTTTTASDWLEQFGGQELIAAGRHDGMCWRRKERYSLTSPVRLFLQSSGEQECHDSALGPVHSLSSDDVTDGIFTLISHNKREKSCLTVSQLLKLCLHS